MPIGGGLISASRIRIVLFSLSCATRLSQKPRRDQQRTHLGQLLVIVPSIQQEFKCFFMARYSGPRERGIARRTRVGVAKVGAFDEPLDEEEIIL